MLTVLVDKKGNYKFSHDRIQQSCYSLFADNAGVKLVAADDIERFIRHLVCSVYHLDPVRDAKDLSRWSSHSLRVGACVALHAMGFSFSTLDIQ
jgi:hypothetical protein